MSSHGVNNFVEPSLYVRLQLIRNAQRNGMRGQEGFDARCAEHLRASLCARPEPLDDFVPEAPPIMTPAQFRDARATLGHKWGHDRPLTMAEFATALRLASADSVRDYERGKTRISGPLSLAVELLLRCDNPPHC